MTTKKDAPPRPPGTDPLFSVSCKDVVLGRGSGTQNHCGNVTYRKLVYLNKELYATSSKFDKLKISKAIVAAVREFRGNFVRSDDKRGGLYYEIGDKRAWDKTSQALREGQGDIRKQLEEEDPAGMSRISEYKKVISEQTFFAYACKMLESLYHPADGNAGITACSQMCPHAKRRQTLNQLGVDPATIHQAMHSLGPEHQYVQPGQPYSANMVSAGANINQITPTSSIQHYQGNPMSMQPPPLAQSSFDPLPYSQDPFVTVNNASIPTPAPEGMIQPMQYAPNTTPTTSASNSQDPFVSVNSISNPSPPQGNIEPLPYVPGQLSTSAMTGGGEEKTFSSYPDWVRSTANSNQNPVDSLPQRPNLLSVRETTTGSVFSLRKFCSESIEMTSEEGKALMDQLNSEVDDLIRRKSLGLVQIDTTHAFEDLVFDDDSMLINDQKPTEKPPKNESGLSSSSSLSKGSLVKFSSINSKGLSVRDDMSLMNMSILTLDDKGLDDDDGNNNLDGSNRGTDTATPKSIIKHHDGDTPNTSKSTKSKRSRGSRVSFAGRNVSIMSLDDHSFSQLVDSITDPSAETVQQRNSINSNDSRTASRKKDFPTRNKSSEFSLGSAISDPDADIDQEKSVSECSSGSHKISRKMGFPMRLKVAEKYGAELPPPEINQTERESYANMSTLTITDEDGALTREPSEFTNLAGRVENPTGAGNSLRFTNMSLSNLSMPSVNNMSEMSLGIDE